MSFFLSLFILYVFLPTSFYLSLSSSIFLSVYFYLSISIRLFLSLSFHISLSISLFLSLSFYLFLSISLFLSLSFYLSVSLKRSQMQNLSFDITGCSMQNIAAGNTMSSQVVDILWRQKNRKKTSAFRLFRSFLSFFVYPLCFCFSLSVSICLSVCLSVSLSLSSRHFFLSFFLSLFLFFL
jgi:hypothetical protein